MTQVKRKILYVEDDEQCAYVLAGVLKLRMNAEVKLEFYGSRAMQVAREFRPNVIVLDYVLSRDMHKGDFAFAYGLEICQKIRADPSLCHIPIIIFSAYADESNCKNVSGIKPCVFIWKDDLDGLVQTIEGMLNGKTGLPLPEA